MLGQTYFIPHMQLTQMYLSPLPQRESKRWADDIQKLKKSYYYFCKSVTSERCLLCSEGSPLIQPERSQSRTRRESDSCVHFDSQLNYWVTERQRGWVCVCTVVSVGEFVCMRERSGVSQPHNCHTALQQHVIQNINIIKPWRNIWWRGNRETERERENRTLGLFCAQPVKLFLSSHLSNTANTHSNGY